jgi:hypothetical protein
MHLQISATDARQRFAKNLVTAPAAIRRGKIALPDLSTNAPVIEVLDPSYFKPSRLLRAEFQFKKSGLLTPQINN